MHGHRIGYVRVSSFEQNPERQLESCPASRRTPSQGVWGHRRRRRSQKVLTHFLIGSYTVSKPAPKRDQASFYPTYK